MTDRPRCVLLGAGGHTCVVIETLRACYPTIDLCVVEREGAPASTRDLLGVPVAGHDAQLPELRARGYHSFAVTLGGTGDNRPRARLFALGVALGLEPLTVQHPSAIVSPSAILGPGCQILAGAVVGSGARLGANVLVNTRAVVEHDCQAGDHVHIATGAVLTGGVALGEGAHVGAGAVLRQGVRMGAWSLVGLGAAVIRDVEAGTTVVGVPARALQRVRESA